MYKILVLIFLIQIMGCSKSNITEKVIDSTMQKEADDGIQFITSTDLGV